ncbi:MAG: hypothetical protein J6T35_07725, partial [Bacteroidales bacterium]|nr:hypothetical protein [Bacteroidales bacterium]
RCGVREIKAAAFRTDSISLRNIVSILNIKQKHFDISLGIGIEKIRVFFTGENMACWSPLFDHCAYLDPEAVAHDSSESQGRSFYPWQKNFMFGIDIQF